MPQITIASGDYMIPFLENWVYPPTVVFIFRADKFPNSYFDAVNKVVNRPTIVITASYFFAFEFSAEFGLELKLFSAIFPIYSLGSTPSYFGNRPLTESYRAIFVDSHIPGYPS
jgi:hypothetical protein